MDYRDIIEKCGLTYMLKHLRIGFLKEGITAVLHARSLIYLLLKLLRVCFGHVLIYSR